MEDLQAKVTEFLTTPGNKEALAGLTTAGALATMNPVIIAAVLGIDWYLVNNGTLSTKI